MFSNYLSGIIIGIISLYPLITQYLLKKNYKKIEINKEQKEQQKEEVNQEVKKEEEEEERNTLQLKLQTENNIKNENNLNNNNNNNINKLNSSLDQIEILIHNVSHTDMVMSIFDSYGLDKSIIARPKFSCFREISSKIESCIREVTLEDLKTIKHPVYSRETNARHPIIRSSNTNQQLDVGFDLLNHQVFIDNIEQLRFRQNDRDKTSQRESSSTIKLSAVYFPLLSMLIPKWLNEVETRGKSNSRKIVFLVSGQGTPRDESARIQDNSTEITAIIMEMFLKKVYPNLEVIQVPSPTINLFRYADNIVFVKRILKPKLDKIRNDLAAKIGAKWLENFHVTISFADGSSARISAISAAIRSYRYK